jgi:hypothetical protein
VAAARKASRCFRSAICQQGNNPPPPSHRFRTMQGLSTLPRAGGFPKAPAPAPPCVFCSPTLFSACSQHTGSPVLVWCVRRPISTFQRHISRHVLHYWSPSSFHLVPVCWQLRRACYPDFARAMAHRGVPSGYVQRTGCSSACGLRHALWGVLSLAGGMGRCAVLGCFGFGYEWADSGWVSSIFRPVTPTRNGI